MLMQTVAFAYGKAELLAQIEAKPGKVAAEGGGTKSAI
jgi:hypothetical protein